MIKIGVIDLPKTTDDLVLSRIKEIAEKYRCQKVILFGSRAKGDHSPVSDYDIAIVDQGLSDIKKAYIFNEIDEIETLKKIDLIFIDPNKEINDSFTDNVLKEGVVIYG